jgi:maltoporin
MRVLQLLGLSGVLTASFLSSNAFAGKASDAAPAPAPQHNTEEPKIAEQSAGVSPTAAAATVAAAAPVVKPKIGDVSVSGYLRGGFGASNQKGRQTCFALPIPGELVSKYRLGNECEVWSETHFSMVAYADDDGSVATLHFMPTVFVPTTDIGYPPTSTVSSPARFTTSTGATLSFPNLYVDMKGISWLHGGSAWIGNRYYKRESVYISDFFYWNPSGVGGGIEDINLGPDLRLSYAIFAVDGEPARTGGDLPQLPDKADFGFRHDLQLRGIKPWQSGEFQIGLQYIQNYSNNPDYHSGWGATLQFVQKVLGGDNKLAIQYGKAGGTGFGTLSRFYYPDFSLHHDPDESRFRLVDVLTVQPTEWFGGQLGLVYQHDDLVASGKRDWYSAGTRLSFAIAKNVKLLGEAGFDRVTKTNGAEPQWLSKFTFAPTLAGGRGLMARPELRLYYTYAMWNVPARTASIDSGRLYADTDLLAGSIFGLQAETWF